jgi:predicted alpha/beta superfamily hydrolase
VRLLTAIFILFFACSSSASKVYNKLPDDIDPNEQYVFYSHGYIVEGTNPRPEHPRWGIYDFPAVVESLSVLNATIIAEHRPSNTDPFEHAKKLTKQIQQLIESGVAPSNISLVGFSRGGFITAITSSLLANKEINYVILAACTSSLAKHEEIVMHGHVFSIYETSDTVGSCSQVVERSGKQVTSFQEITISTGKEHGAFYRPLDAWVLPIKDWLKRRNIPPPYTMNQSEVIELVDPSSRRIYPILIKLPRSYNKNTDRRYPVVYMTDAPYSFPLVTGSTRSAMNSGSMKEVIIVAVSYSINLKGSSSRVRDYTHTSAPSWKMQTGGAIEHLAFFKDSLFPYIESNYRVVDEDRTYVGHSLGGLLGAYALLSSPDMFSGYILSSPSIWFDKFSVLKIKASKPTQTKSVFIAVGSLETPEFGEREDMVHSAKRLIDKIETANFSNLVLKSVVIDGAKHSTAFPTASIQGLDWLHGKR